MKRLSQVTEGFLTVIERQATDYQLAGLYAGMDPEMIFLKQNANNITAGTILRMRDHLKEERQLCGSHDRFPTNKT